MLANVSRLNSQKYYEQSSEAKAQICFNLLSPDRSKPTMLFIVYSTIQANPGITQNSLRKILANQFLISAEVVDSIVAYLASLSLFNIVTKWWDPDKPEIVKLRVSQSPSPEFVIWLDDFCKQYPEMTYFKAPTKPRTHRSVPSGSNIYSSSFRKR